MGSTALPLLLLLISILHSGLTEDGRDLPRPALTVTPDSAVFTGETVNLKCVIEFDHSDWTYEWYKDSNCVKLQSDGHYTVNRDTLIIRGAAESDQGQYWCKGVIGWVSIQSSAVSLSVKDLPRSSVTVTPDSAVFTGETVNLKCVTESDHSDWTYEWYKDRNSVKLQSDGHYTVNRDTLTIRGADWSDQGQYWCKGQRSGRPNSSQSSSAVYFSVKALPRSTVTMIPDSAVFTGETVNLKCVIESDHSDWTYEWYKDRNSVKLQSSDRYTVNRDTLTIRGVKTNEGSYECKGLKAGRSVSTQPISFHISVMTRPKPVVKVSPDQRVFTGETVTLTCDIQTGGNIQWIKYSWIKDGDTHNPHRTTSAAELSFRADSVSVSGQYSCRGERSDSQRSDISAAVTLTVSALPRSTVTVTPDSAVFTGETVNLKCVITPYYSNWRYEWYKDTNKKSVLQTSKLQTLTIRGAAESDQGQYWCRGQRSGRPNSTQSSSAVSLSVKDLKPKPELRSDSAGAALTGNTVTLTCDTDLSTGWDFYWYKNTQESEIQKTETNSYSMKIDSVSDEGQYWCRAGRGEPVYYTQYSDELTLSVTESPKAVVTVRPDKHVFRGETVTLRCDIKWRGNTEWTYRWQIDKPQTANKPINPCTRPDCCTSGTTQQNYRTAVSRCSTQELKISRVEVFHRGKYSCTGQMNTQSSQRSDAVALTVSSDEAQAAVRVSPQPWLTEGHSVTLICEVPGSSTGWTFSWFRDADHLSDSSRGAGGSYTLSPAALQHTGVYTCRAERGEPAYSSQNSSAQPLWVTGVSASVRLVLRPSRSQHFSSDSLSLSCDSAGWTVRRYTHTNTQDCSAQTGSTCGIQSLSTSDTGVYWCESESGEKHHPLNITVHDGAVILASSADPVIEGETLTLHCLHRSTHSSILTADFYKDGSLIQNQTTGEMSIPTVSKSDEGFYYCETERGESPHSWISVRASSSSSSPLVIGVSVGLTVFLLFLILLVLLLRHKKKRDQDHNNQQTSNPVPTRSGESQLENVPLQSEPVSDVTYSKVIVKKKKSMDKADTVPESTNVTYSKIRKNMHKDINSAGPSDLIYTEINMKDEKKTKSKGFGLADVLIKMKSKEKRSGQSSESGDTLYSEVKQNTDRGADAEVDATYAQPIRKKKNKTRL